MAIKNYTTTVNASKTVGFIQQILAENGAKKIEIEFLAREPEAVKFWIDVHKNSFCFRLPCNPHGVLNSMKRDKVRDSLCNPEQARRVSWRIIKDWIHAQLAIIDAGQATMSEVFFPYLIDQNGETYYSQFENSQKLLSE